MNPVSLNLQATRQIILKFNLLKILFDTIHQDYTFSEIIRYTLFYKLIYGSHTFDDCKNEILAIISRLPFYFSKRLLLQNLPGASCLPASVLLSIYHEAVMMNFENTLIDHIMANNLCLHCTPAEHFTNTLNLNFFKDKIENYCGITLDFVNICFQPRPLRHV